MKIAQSNVNLASTHTNHEENSIRLRSGTVTRSSFIDSLKGQEKKMDSLEKTEVNLGDAALGSENYTSFKPAKTESLSTGMDSLEDQLSQIRISLLERIIDLLRLLWGDSGKRGYHRTLSNTANMLGSNMLIRTSTVTVTHVEEEETTFCGKGKALTDDGREIDFNVEFSMSRSLTEYAGMSMSDAVSFIDPLVINVGNDVTHISDQSFYFDLDSDGREDKISNPGKGNGFLAYDKNGDGIIGNGSELFGTKSGNGFRDLGAYDGDGNGWIDENDEIYDKLRIWIRNEDGTDTLMNLKEADVGAIYLGNAPTEFSHINNAFMHTAQTRASGVFLRESGGVGMVQQIDLAAL
ncbi:MAG: hypothetical protein K6E91_07725 [Butyrivibrio sp.]|nr:hypothetical protein [Butyrivibrio sp.]